MWLFGASYWESRGCTGGHRFPHPHPPPSPHSLRENRYPSPLNLTLTLLDQGGCPEHDGRGGRQAKRSRAREANACLFGSEISTGHNVWTGQATERRRRLPGGVRRRKRRGEARIVCTSTTDRQTDPHIETINTNVRCHHSLRCGSLVRVIGNPGAVHKDIGSPTPIHHPAHTLWGRIDILLPSA